MTRTTLTLALILAAGPTVAGQNAAQNFREQSALDMGGGGLHFTTGFLSWLFAPEPEYRNGIPGPMDPDGRPSRQQMEQRAQPGGQRTDGPNDRPR